MSLGDRLRELDERVLPNPWAGKFDARVPAWMAYVPFLGGVPAGFAFYYVIKHLHGTSKFLSAIGIILVVGAWSVAEWRWRHRHRLSCPADSTNTRGGSGTGRTMTS